MLKTKIRNNNYKPIPLYTHPSKEQYKFGVDWSKDGNAVTVLKVYEGGVAEVVFTDYQEVLNVPSNTCKHGVDDGACKECYQEATQPAKTLTTKEIADVWFSLYKEAIPMMDVVILATFGEAILKKASEK